MKWLNAPLGVLGLLATAGMPAAAASPEFCTLYAQEYADQHRAGDGQSPAAVRDKAYFTCLNQDDEPKLPTVQAATEPSRRADPARRAASKPAPAVAEPDAAVKTPPAEITNADEASPRPARKKGRYRGSGFPQGSKEWVAWCAAHYKSFDPETGFYQPFSGPKAICE